MSKYIFILTIIVGLTTFCHNENDINMKTPKEMLDDDINNEKVIYSETDALLSILNKCEQIVKAAYKVTNFTPNLANNTHAQFWNEIIIPNLVEGVAQNVKARSLIIHSFGSINALSITIQKSVEMVTQSKGSARSIEIAKKWIPKALNELNGNLEKAMLLDNNGIINFEKQTLKLFEIIGPESAKFVDKKVEIEIQLNQLYGEQEKLFQTLSDKQGEATRLNSMIIALGGKLPQINSKGLTYSTTGSVDLNKINKAIVEAVKKVPGKIKEQILQHSVSGWKLLKKVYNNELDLPNSNIGGNYYNGIIQAMPQANFNVGLPELQGQYVTVLRYLEKILKEFNVELISKQKQIDNLLLKIADVDKDIKDLDDKTGLINRPLIDCLTAVKAFVATLKDGANVYAPLASILKGVNAYVEMDVELMNSTVATDVTLALNLLSKQVRFLSSFTLDVGYVLDPSTQPNIPFNFVHNSKDNISSFANVILINWNIYICIISLLILININVNL